MDRARDMKIPEKTDIREALMNIAPRPEVRMGGVWAALALIAGWNNMIGPRQ